MLLLLAASPALAQSYRRQSLGKAESIPLKVQSGAAGTTVKLSDYADKQLVLYVYDGRCSDCRDGLVYLQRLHTSFGTLRPIPIIAVEVQFSGEPVVPLNRPETGQLISVVDVDGKLWKELNGVQAVDSPPGAKAQAPEVLPLTLFVGTWTVRNRGTSRIPIDRYVQRRSKLLTLVAWGYGPKTPELDIEDEELLRLAPWNASGSTWPLRAEQPRGAGGP